MFKNKNKTASGAHRTWCCRTEAQTKAPEWDLLPAAPGPPDTFTTLSAGRISSGQCSKFSPELLFFPPWNDIISQITL